MSNPAQEIIRILDSRMRSNAKMTVPTGGAGTKGTRVARFTIGTAQNGWTAEEVDYLCDGTNDQEEIIQALNALPATGGEVVILDGTYNITASINIPKDNVSIRGNGNATILKRMYNSTSGAVSAAIISSWSSTPSHK